MRPFLSGSGSSGQLIGRVEMLMLAIVLLWNWNWQTNLDEKHPVQKQIKQRQENIEHDERADGDHRDIESADPHQTEAHAAFGGRLTLHYFFAVALQFVEQVLRHGKGHIG